VAPRAAQLLRPLWKKGEGSVKQEKTGGRWITYRATLLKGKRGVVAWRLIQKKPTPEPGDFVVVSTKDGDKEVMIRKVIPKKPKTKRKRKPKRKPNAAPAPAPAPKPAPAPEPPPPPVTQQEVKPPPKAAVEMNLPTLMQGNSGENVVTLQKRLGMTGKLGFFGPMTRARVVAFQKAKGLDADGIVGKKTWGALFA
jgi:outer membrane biosynthesis protein TonB